MSSKKAAPSPPAPRPGLGAFLAKGCVSLVILLLAIATGTVFVFDAKPVDYQAVASSGEFRNYGLNLRFPVDNFIQPGSEQEIEAIVNKARSLGKVVRVVGAGHSWAPLVAVGPGDFLLNLDKLASIVHVDQEKLQVRVQAGIRLKNLGPALWDLGLALPIIGTVDEQSIAGAMSTGTHGSNSGMRSIPDAVVAMRLVLGTGVTVEASPSTNPDIYNASRNSFGSIGILTEVTLQCVKRFHLRRVYEPAAIDSALANLDKLRASNAYFKLWWLPYSDSARLFLISPTTDPISSDLAVSKFIDTVTNRLASGLYYAAQKLGQVPTIGPFLALAANTRGDAVGRSYEMLTWPMPYHYMETEWFVPAERAKEVFRAFRAMVESEKCPITYVTEIRYIKADNNWLSPYYGRDSAAINLLLAANDAEFFRCANLFEDMLTSWPGLDARPHWGKYHRQKAAQLSALYGEGWAAFQAVRARTDPNGVFLNEYLKGKLVE